MNSPTPKHHARYYVVMSTLVVAGIFFLLMMNDDNGLSITGSTVGLFDNSSAAEKIDYEVEFGDADEGLPGTEKTATTIEDVLSKEVEKESNEVDVALSFDRIPNIQNEAKIQEIELLIDDASTKIYVNKDRLELSNVEEVRLKINGFSGELQVDENDFSLDGTVKKLEVNGVSLSSRDKIGLSFEGVNYQYAKISDIQLKDLVLENGNGILNAGGKLNYNLESDKVKLFYFNGEISLNKENETMVSLEGVARGISVSGGLAEFTLK